MLNQRVAELNPPGTAGAGRDRLPPARETESETFLTVQTKLEAPGLTPFVRVVNLQKI